MARRETAREGCRARWRKRFSIDSTGLWFRIAPTGAIFSLAGLLTTDLQCVVGAGVPPHRWRDEPRCAGPQPVVSGSRTLALARFAA
jgi:hypothetical protein